jgi:hypothetical protein
MVQGSGRPKDAQLDVKMASQIAVVLGASLAGPLDFLFDLKKDKETA